jgi:hypothetical protein
MLRAIKNQKTPTTIEHIRKLESKYRVHLPETYVQFLLKHNGGQPEPDTYPITGLANNPVGLISEFYGVSNVFNEFWGIDEAMDDIHGLVPGLIVPIGSDGGPNDICIDARFGGETIVYWDRNYFWGSDIWRNEDLYFIADDFTRFIECLQDYGNTT